MLRYMFHFLAACFHNSPDTVQINVLIFICFSFREHPDSLLSDTGSIYGNQLVSACHNCFDEPHMRSAGAVLVVMLALA